MIQRIQSVFLLLAAASMVLAIVLPIAIEIAGGQTITFEAMGFYRNGNLIFGTFGLFILGGISAMLSLITIFLYKKRKLQIKLTTINIIIMFAFYVFIILMLFFKNPETNAAFQNMGIGVIMPAISIIFSWLAIRKIGEDEALIKSLNRLRK
jgi:amino acid transporter